MAWDIPLLQKKWLNFPSCSEATKRRCTKRSSDIVAAVLKTISPENAGYIWQDMTSSASMNKWLDIEDISQTDHRYLEALAVAYCNANSWDARRQILSVMTGVAGYKVIASFIQGLTKYRFTVGNLHRLQFGRGAPIPFQPSTRIRVDLKQLDQFLFFITSPHLIRCSVRTETPDSFHRSSHRSSQRDKNHDPSTNRVSVYPILSGDGFPAI